MCDIVEFHRADDGVQLYRHRGLFRVYPIEYKKESLKIRDIDILQLTAQAMCLEEMFSTAVSEGHSIMGKQSAGKKSSLQNDLRLQVKK